MRNFFLKIIKRKLTNKILPTQKLTEGPFERYQGSRAREQELLELHKKKLGSPFFYERDTLLTNARILSGLSVDEAREVWLDEADFYERWAVIELNELLPLRQQSEKDLQKVTRLHQEEKDDIYREFDPSLTDEDLKFRANNNKYHQLCFFLCQQANALNEAGYTERALEIAKQCIFEMYSNDPIAFSLASQLTDERRSAKELLDHIDRYTQLKSSNKLKYAINQLTYRYENNIFQVDLEMQQVYDFVLVNPGINKGRLHSGLRKKYGWYHDPTTQYIEKALELEVILQVKTSRSYEHYINDKEMT